MSSSGLYWAGIDVGAATTKAAIIDRDGGLKGYHVQRSGVDYQAGSKDCLERALVASGIDPQWIGFVVATGYGRYNVPVAKKVKTEISCHMKGCFFYFPWSSTVVDIGGQDCKIIKVDDKGRRVGFKMNRKCAAGTGAFLEEMALRLGIEVSELERLARSSMKRIKLGSYCTVFTATEILTLIRRGEKIEDIARGLFESIVQRILEMDSFHGPVIVTGGVVEHNPIVADLLQERIPGPVHIPPHPQLMGAFGAALYGRDEALQGSEGSTSFDEKRMSEVDI